MASFATLFHSSHGLLRVDANPCGVFLPLACLLGDRGPGSVFVSHSADPTWASPQTR